MLRVAGLDDDRLEIAVSRGFPVVAGAVHDDRTRRAVAETVGRSPELAAHEVRIHLDVDGD